MSPNGEIFLLLLGFDFFFVNILHISGFLWERKSCDVLVGGEM